MSGEQWGEAVDYTAAVDAAAAAIGQRITDWPAHVIRQAAAYAIATAAPLIVADTLKRDRERMTAALLHILTVSNPRDRWDEGYAAGIGEAMHWITPGASVTDEDFARGSGNGGTA